MGSTFNSGISGTNKPNNYSKSAFHGTDKGKKISEKKENTHVYYEDGCKITETVITVTYNDGTMEENI